MKYRIIIIFMLILTLPLPVKGATNLILRDRLGDQSWTYEYLEKLKSAGLIGNIILNTRPLNRDYFARLIIEARENYLKREEEENYLDFVLHRLENEFEAEIKSLKGIKNTPSTLPGQDYFKIDRWELNLYYLSRINSLENISGDWLNKDLSFRKDLYLRGNIKKYFDFYLHPRLKLNQHNNPEDIFTYYHPLGPNTQLNLPRQDRVGIDLLEGYGKLTFKNLEIEIGRDSLWWGPGYHGSLLLSNQAPPFNLFKLSNSVPFRLPYLLKYLGEIKIDWFLTRLEKERGRAISRPYLNGTRIVFSPFSFFSLGLTRMILFGGEGMTSLTPEHYSRVFFISKKKGEGTKFENNQLAAIDFTLYLTNLKKWLPLAEGMTLYYELDGDDQATKIADNPVGGGGMGGIYFYGLFLVANLDLRVEYVRNHEGDRQDVHDLWYNHAYYRYTYQERVIGHHMGTDADNIFVRLSEDFFFLKVALEFERERHRIFELEREYKYEGALNLLYRYSRRLSFQAKFEYGLIENNNFIRGNTIRYNTTIMGMGYDF